MGLVCKCNRGFKNKQAFNKHQKYCRGAVFCKNCGKGLEAGRKWKNLFCDNKCSTEFLYKQYIERWLAGKESGFVKKGHSNHLKKYLINKCGEKCSLCGWAEHNEISGKIPIELDHIDGNHENNLPSNIRLLCPNCHSLTPTYKNMNKGKGRQFRNKPPSHSG